MHKDGYRAMKTALFLDVDMTLTTDFIQHVYAKELGVEKEYQELENAFQLGLVANKEKAKNGISSAVFGTRLSNLFAGRQFTRAKALEFFSKVKLRENVHPIFEWQKKGIAIYLVSSGPNYYIDALASRNNIPLERTKSSTYHFRENDGIVDGCNAVNAQDKHNFVQREIGKYDLTIGIGDSDQHDTFVSLCTISMYTVAHNDYIHLTEFSAVSRILEKLLERDAGSTKGVDVLDVDDLKTVPLKEAFHRLSVGVWLLVIGLVVGAFTLGYSAHDFFSSKAPPAQSAK
jgi:phosphoserine phosphatase